MTPEGEPVLSKIIPHAIIAIVVLVIFFSSWTIISPGEKGVIVRLGDISREADPGINLLLPIVESVVKFDVRTQKDNFDVSAASKDLQTVSANIAVNYNLDSKSVTNMYREVWPDYVTRILAPAIHESVKAATAQFTADELITKRAGVKDAIKVTLSERMLKYGLVVSDVSIVDFNFSSSFNEAIEKKVTAEQDALAAKNKLEQTKYESEQRLTQARAESEAIRIQAQAINSQGGADYVKLKWIESVGSKWDGKLPVTALGEATPLLNLWN